MSFVFRRQPLLLPLPPSTFAINAQPLESMGETSWIPSLLSVYYACFQRVTQCLYKWELALPPSRLVDHIMITVGVPATSVISFHFILFHYNILYYIIL